jgi:hypothetical protein
MILEGIKMKCDTCPLLTFIEISWDGIAVLCALDTEFDSEHIVPPGGCPIEHYLS